MRWFLFLNHGNHSPFGVRSLGTCLRCNFQVIIFALWCYLHRKHTSSFHSTVNPIEVFIIPFLYCDYMWSLLIYLKGTFVMFVMHYFFSLKLEKVSWLGLGKCRVCANLGSCWWAVLCSTADKDPRIYLSHTVIHEIHCFKNRGNYP